MDRDIREVADALKGKLTGEVLRPRDHGFEQARAIWNGMVARTPGLIIRCASVADVQSAVRVTKAAGALTAVRCGGHSLAGFGTCEGGVVIDLSYMRQVSVDEANRRALVAGGCLLDTIDTATQKVALAYPAGVVSHTGASGLILGGGTGWLTRLLGLSCDNVEAFTLVAADGSLLRASARENTDLFWALRGGGGNFGVVTEFEIRLHPIRSVLLGEALWVDEDIPRMLRCWREFMPDAPDALKWNVSLTLVPESNPVPRRFHGRPAMIQTVVWFGDPGDGHGYFDQVFGGGNPVKLSRKLVSFLDLQTMADNDFPHGDRYYTKSGYFLSLDDSTIDVMLGALNSIPSAKCQIELAYLGGAAARVGATETAFGDRTAPYIMNLIAHWTHPQADSANVGWVRSLFESLRPWLKPGVYVNFMSGDEGDRVQEAYNTRWERLLAIKKHYDPENFFRLNHNITERGETQRIVRGNCSVRPA